MAEDSQPDQLTEQSMADLLEESLPPRKLRRGDLLQGRVMRSDQDGLLVSTGHKSEGIVPLQELKTHPQRLLDRCSVGSTVAVRVLDPTGFEGQAVFALDKTVRPEIWARAEECASSGEVLKGVIVGQNKGGAIVDLGGLEAFLPLSQITLSEDQGDSNGNVLETRMGETLTLKVIEVDRYRNKAIVSEKMVFHEQKESQKDELFLGLTAGEVRSGIVTHISTFGAFVDIGGVDGLVHISELSWAPVSVVEEVVKIGETIDVYVLKVDQEKRRIALSLKQLTPNPWDEIGERFFPGRLVSGTVTKLTDFGAFARIEETVEGLIHISELSESRAKHASDIVNVGDQLTLRILRVEPERHRIALSLKQAQEARDFEEWKSSQDSESS